MKRMNKAEMMQAVKAAFVNKPVRIEGIEPLEAYAKVFTVKDITENSAKLDDIRTKYKDDNLSYLRALCLEICNEDGSTLFDYADDDDVDFLANLPHSIIDHIRQTVQSVNTIDQLKKAK